MDRYFYSVEMDGDQKVVHLLGNIFFNDGDETDTCFRYAEWVGLCFTIKELKILIKDNLFYEYLYEKVEYLTDLTEEQAIESCQTYFAGTPGTRLHIRSVNEDTPCGDYWFE